MSRTPPVRDEFAPSGGEGSVSACWRELFSRPRPGSACLKGPFFARAEPSLKDRRQDVIGDVCAEADGEKTAYGQIRVYVLLQAQYPIDESESEVR